MSDFVPAANELAEFRIVCIKRRTLQADASVDFSGKIGPQIRLSVYFVRKISYLLKLPLKATGAELPKIIVRSVSAERS